MTGQDGNRSSGVICVRDGAPRGGKQDGRDITSDRIFIPPNYHGTPYVSRLQKQCIRVAQGSTVAPSSVCCCTLLGGAGAHAAHSGTPETKTKLVFNTDIEAFVYRVSGTIRLNGCRCDGVRVERL